MQEKRRVCLIGFIVAVLFVSFAVFWGGCGEQESPEKQKEPGKKKIIHVTAAENGLDAFGDMQVSRKDNCSICGMPVHKHLKFATGIELVDGTAFYFCGTQCLVRAWLQPDIYLGTPKESVKRSIVTSYFSGNHIQGKDAFFIMGSDVMGPMGPSLIALSNEKERDSFIGRHGGTAVYGITAVSKTILEQASGKKFER